MRPDPGRLKPTPAYKRGGWYVDSVNGSDANSGTSWREPLQTISALLGKSIAQNSRIWLARGSWWREQLAGLPNGCTVSAYGSGNRPMFDCSNVAVNANFTKTVGLTNVYQIAWSHALGATKTAHRVWVNGTRLTRVASTAACDAAPGSFYAGAPTASGPDTVYVHPPGSTNPTSDGKTYELAYRPHGINVRDTRSVAIYSLQAQRNGHNDGSILSQYYADDCVALDGMVHNFWVQGTAEDCVAQYMEPPAAYGGATMFVSFTDGTVGADTPGDQARVWLRRCQVIGEDTANTIGYYVHTSGAVKFVKAIYEDCSAGGVNLAFGGANVDTAVIKGATVSNVVYGAGVGSAVAVHILGGSFVAANTTNTRLWNGYDFSVPTVNVYGARFVTQNGSGRGLYVRTAGNTLNVENVTLYNTGGVALKADGGSLVLSKSIIRGPGGDWGLQTLAGASVTSDNNDWYNVFGWSIAGSSYLTLSAFQSATSQDANSITSDPQFTGTPTSGNTVISGASPAYVAGMGADVPGVLEEVNRRFSTAVGA